MRIQFLINCFRQEVCGLKFSGLQPSLLASGGNDNKLFVWDERKTFNSTADSTSQSGQPNSAAALHKFHEHTGAVKAIAWSPHAVGILGSGGGTQDKKLRFWNTGTGNKISELDTGSQVWNCFHISAYGTHCRNAGVQSDLVSELERNCFNAWILFHADSKSDMYMGM